jgi:hypothetical protein
MTEAEWLACEDLAPMLEHLRGTASERKLRLVACACVHRLSGHFKDERAAQAIGVTERYADGAAGKAELRRARQAVRAAQEGLVLQPHRRPESRAYEAVAFAATEKDYAKAIPEAWLVAKLPATGIRVAREPFPSMLLRDIAGNPFHPVTVNPAWLTWHDGLLVSMAQKMYDGRDFSDMPILADALEEAGCTDADILSHCRGPGPHVRGCHVIDLLLGLS